MLYEFRAKNAKSQRYPKINRHKFIFWGSDALRSWCLCATFFTIGYVWTPFQPIVVPFGWVWILIRPIRSTIGCVWTHFHPVAVPIGCFCTTIRPIAIIIGCVWIRIRPIRATIGCVWTPFHPIAAALCWVWTPFGRVGGPTLGIVRTFKINRLNSNTVSMPGYENVMIHRTFDPAGADVAIPIDFL